ncbi:hypothetical protein Glove_148g6 [Diversispora epigaea]|uniref:Uncharacterized protein n=1 Tax=Diversispora epigaea TaxID=1348612 RepID=A0A397IYA5_9GLOM|nr:hypothetical protein Glove_148g6 [Diversispora epigaea]
MRKKNKQQVISSLMSCHKLKNLDDINNLFSENRLLKLNTCYVSKPLEAQVLENLSALLDYKFSLLSHTSGDTSDMISLKDQYLPQKHHSATAAYNVRNNKGIKISTDDWHKPSGSFTTGVQWLYHFTAQELYKDDLHSGHRYIKDKDNMKVFYIMIKQVLNHKIKSNKLSPEFKLEKNRNIIVESIESNNPCFKRKLEKSETEQKLYIKLLKYF